MANIMDYLTWRGDLTFKKSPINEIDKIILSRVSYLPFKEIKINKNGTIENISKSMENLDIKKFLWKDDKEFIIKLGQTNRFKNLIISDYNEILDIEAEKQFAAVTIWLPNRYKYISFRGTDTSLVGWKEDLNMSFMQNIPSQKEAALYLNEIGKKYKNKLILGGHSKGGNLAVYAAIFCNDNIRKRIIEIINADGPGFDESIINSNNYNNVMEKVNTYIPQSSIIGRLLEHDDDYDIIYSTQKGVMQHDIFSWQVNVNNLVRIQKLTDDSDFVNEVLRNWLKNTTIEQRKNFINIIYEVIVTSEIKKVTDFKIDTVKKISNVIKTYRNIDNKEKKEIEKMVRLLFESIIKIIKENRKEVI